jgi:hypothetical protein
MTEIGNINCEFTWFGWKNLFEASISRKTVISQMLESDTTVPIISALLYPKVFLLSDLR